MSSAPRSSRRSGRGQVGGRAAPRASCRLAPAFRPPALAAAAVSATTFQRSHRVKDARRTPPPTTRERRGSGRPSPAVSDPLRSDPGPAVAPGFWLSPARPCGAQGPGPGWTRGALPRRLPRRAAPGLPPCARGRPVPTRRDAEGGARLAPCPLTRALGVRSGNARTGGR